MKIAFDHTSDKQRTVPVLDPKDFYSLCGFLEMGALRERWTGVGRNGLCSPSIDAAAASNKIKTITFVWTSVIFLKGSVWTAFTQKGLFRFYYWPFWDEIFRSNFQKRWRYRETITFVWTPFTQSFIVSNLVKLLPKIN